QALYITFLALALENDDFYDDEKGQQFYIDQVLNQNSFKQKALKDVVKNYDQKTGIWPEVAGYNMLVANDMLEIYSLMDNTLENNLVEQYPIVEKANLAIFQYLFPNGYTVSYGDAKHSRIRFNALELLIANYRKYKHVEKEKLITAQLKKFMADGAYSRENINSLFQLFFYVEELTDVPPAESFSDLVSTTYYAPNVSWLVQRNGNSPENGMMISKNASLGNHSHTNGVSIELFAKGMVIAPDCAAGVSYWTEDHRDYYSRFAAHNTVVVDGISDYRNMRGSQAFDVNSIYPSIENSNPLNGDFTFSDVTFNEPSTDATQQRVTGTVRTSESSGYFIDIFRSERNDGKDKKHEYLFHGQGNVIILSDFDRKVIVTKETDELSSAKGDLKGYNYFKNKRGVKSNDNFIAHFGMPSLFGETLNVNFWMKGDVKRELFTVEAPYSRAINKESVPQELYHKSIPTLVVRQFGEARTKPFVAVIDAFNQSEGNSVKRVDYFQAENENTGFVGIKVQSANDRYDLIFNDENPESENHFVHGEIKGGFGIISKVGKEFQSMLLHNGTVFEHGNFRIELKKKGDVLIQVIPSGFEIKSSQPALFTIPVDEKNSEALKLISAQNKISLIGKIVQKENLRLVTFELPALNSIQFQYQ
ncbi:MAG: hypothetical protein HOG79_15385, partial [Prolixibacteraceae bacterium]|nr:hypothetical protein [Prolixibacteraceae bacterium]